MTNPTIDLISASSFARPSHPASVPQTTAQKPYRLTFLGISLSHLIDTYGYAALFLLVGLESVGVPLPGETALITAALYAGSTHRLNIAAVIGVAALAAILGDNLGFLLGRWGGVALLARYGRYVRFDARRMKIGR